MDRSTRCELMAQMQDVHLRQLLTDLGKHDAEVVTEPTAGMLMMRVLEDAHGETFNLGEVLVTECVMRVQSNEGWAMLMGHRPEGARIAATIDAIVAADPASATLIESTLKSHAANLQEKQNAHFARLAPTRVQFETQ